MELKRLTVLVEEAEAVLARLRQSLDEEHDAGITSTEQDERHIQSMALLQQLTTSQPDLDEKIQKFVDKLAWRDPITNDPRYGPAMQEKILAVAGRISAVKEAAAAATDVIEPKASVALQNQQLRKQAQDDLDAECLKKEQERACIEAQQVIVAQEVLQKQLKEAEIAAQIEREALAKAAQAVRDERARAQAEKERQDAEAQRQQDELNQSIPVGLTGLEMALGLLGRHFQSDAATFRAAKRTLLVLLKNICAAPDNATFRHINAANEHFHRELGQFPGGLQCLLALGFRPLRQGSTSDDGAPAPVIYVLEVRTVQ
ncbi:hypothetical protein DYB37_001503 [Aphanomyces astaci]|uniref:PUB domain-containing protein n=2 Tax=Aphanomyces astaci TaxID=112090 RepID=A0A397DJ00_APHAT|nr:hypothetical protein DYB30_003106 [Aphanomyces astaci]RHZ25123.1 hypothetical protein DYB37_001503 [Aphanomyces astaci]